MPRHDWFDDDTMSHERRHDRDYEDRGSRERGFGNYEDRDRGAMFGRGRDGERGRERDRDRNQPIGGWGGLMGENMDRDRNRDRYRDSDRSRGEDRDRDRSRSEGRRFGPDDYNRGIPMDETEQLIASNKVEGTPVYDRHGDKLGTIHNFMVHKTKGHVVYAVLKHGGGFLGLNERYYPLEWNQLDYDTRLGGYHVDLEEEDLKNFGSFDREGRWQSRRQGGRQDRERMDREGSDRDRSDRDWFKREREYGRGSW